MVGRRQRWRRDVHTGLERYIHRGRKDTQLASKGAASCLRKNRP